VRGAAFNPLNVSNQQLNRLETYKTTRRKYYDCCGVAGGKKGDRRSIDDERGGGKEQKRNGWRAISRQNPKLVINFGQKCPKTYPKLTEVQSPEVLTPGNFLSLNDVTSYVYTLQGVE
jgi:hypothetical protein